MGKTGVRDKPGPGRPIKAVTPRLGANVGCFSFQKKDHRVTL